MEKECPYCGGHLEPLGRMGKVTVWHRCRQCGIDISSVLEPGEEIDSAEYACDEWR